MADLRRIVLDPNKFRKARLNAGLTQETVADKIGIGKASISKIETGKTRPSASILLRFILLVKTDASELTARSSRAG